MDSNAAALSDPRLLRRLPWGLPQKSPIKNVPRWLGMVVGLAYVVANTISVLVIPGWVVWRTLRSGRYSMRGLMACMMAIALSISSIQLFSMFYASTFEERIILTLVGLPIVAIPLLVSKWIRLREWGKALVYFAIAIGISVAMAAFMLSLDRESMQATETYDLSDWYTVIPVGGYFAILLMPLVHIILNLTGIIRQWTVGPGAIG